MDTYKTHFLATTYTVTAAHQRLALLRRVLEALYFSAASEEPITERLARVTSTLTHEEAAGLAAFDSAFIESQRAETVQAVLSEWQQWLATLPTFTLYVPVVFEDEQIILLGRWCRSEIAQSVLLELIVEPAVVGGCAFIHNHTYHDFSLRARLNRTPHTIPAIIATYESV
jgi:F0F1-type ATP synthase delta subunit